MKDGGPAFPIEGRVIYGLNDPSGEFPQGSGSVTVNTVRGMSLRDYFAAAALTGMVTKDARRAYEIADMMLTAREKP